MKTQVYSRPNQVPLHERPEPELADGRRRVAAAKVMLEPHG
jgi:hypothetical protein